LAQYQGRYPLVPESFRDRGLPAFTGKAGIPFTKSLEQLNKLETFEGRVSDAGCRVNETKRNLIPKAFGTDT